MTNIPCEEIARQFQLTGNFIDAARISSGHIHDTYVVRFGDPAGDPRRAVLQRINRSVFRDPPAVMENVERVTRHLREKISAAGGDPQRETLNLIPTWEGGSFYRDPSGEYWRAYHFIEGARTRDAAETPQQVYSAAWAFGHFQRQLADFPPAQLRETIPNFHNTPSRFAAFVDALQRDPAGRAALVRAEVDFLLAREADTRVLAEGAARGDLPLHVTHNDTKFNNVMFDDQTGQAICVVDLDTVMPGLALYDFGDAVRSGAARIAEDAAEITGPAFSLETFGYLARGYLEAARSFLTRPEIDHLAFAARLITLEQALRFLADYLNGDVYYKIHRPSHNLDRARTQIQLLREMEDQFEAMRAAVQACARPSIREP